MFGEQQGQDKLTCVAGAQDTAETAGDMKLGSQACLSRRVQMPWGGVNAQQGQAVEGQGPGNPAP